jgi:hypothetical protein
MIFSTFAEIENKYLSHTFWYHNSGTIFQNLHVSKIMKGVIKRVSNWNLQFSFHPLAFL